VEHLIRNKVENIIIANRTFKRGIELAERFNGKAIRFEEISDCLKFVDIIISSTDSPSFIITRDQVKKIIRTRRNRPIFFIDIAVPRDIDPKINRLANSYVYDIDDLKSVINENIEDRNRESIKGERIIDEAEINKTFQSLNHLSDDDRQAIHRMTNSLISKILHDPTLMLKSNGCYRNKSVYLDIARKLFKLDD
jgi:glutamyl-tRNA reductase